jgi:hypothetical protein
VFFRSNTGSHAQKKKPIEREVDGTRVKYAAVLLSNLKKKRRNAWFPSLNETESDFQQHIYVPRVHVTSRTNGDSQLLL